MGLLLIEYPRRDRVSTSKGISRSTGTDGVRKSVHIERYFKIDGYRRGPIMYPHRKVFQDQRLHRWGPIGCPHRKVFQDRCSPTVFQTETTSFIILNKLTLIKLNQINVINSR